MEIVIAMVIGGVILGALGLQTIVSVTEAVAKRYAFAESTTSNTRTSGSTPAS